MLSYDLQVKLDIEILDRGDATLQDASDKYKVVSGRGDVIVEEEYDHPYHIQVLVSKDLGKEEMVVGLEDLKALGILYKDFARKMPNKSKW